MPVCTVQLFATIKSRLMKEKGRLRSISAQSGVPYPTLTKITSGAVTDPRISTIQALYDYFEEHAEPSVQTSSVSTH